LAVERTRGAPIRASAAEFVGQLLEKTSNAEPAKPAETKQSPIAPGPAAVDRQSASVVNALIGAASDPEAIVRIAAVRSLAAVDLQTAIDLDPREARPRVLLGVLAARAGKYDDAIRHWKAAKILAPSYQNLDRLIEEAQKRLKQP